MDQVMQRMDDMIVIFFTYVIVTLSLSFVWANVFKRTTEKGIFAIVLVSLPVTYLLLR